MVDYGEKISLWGNGLILEVIRQWFELISGIVMLIWFMHSAYWLKRTFKTWFVLDIMLILILWVRVLLFLVFEFVYPSRIFPYIADSLFLWVLIMIFYMFARAIFPNNMHKIFNKKTYVSILILLLVGNIIFAIIDNENAFRCDDDKIFSGTEVHSLAMHILELIIGLGNLICTFVVIKIHEKKQITQTQQEQDLMEILDQKQDFKEAKKKLWIVAIGGLISSIFRSARVLISQILIKNSVHYQWRQGMYYFATDNITELFIWYR